MTNLYETLGVPRTASEQEIKAAVRYLMRRYQEESARGERDPAQALQVVNQVRLTFADPRRKQAYDRALAAGEEAPPITEERPASAPASAPKPTQPAAVPRPATPPAPVRPLTLREEHLSAPAADLLPPIFPTTNATHASASLPQPKGQAAESFPLREGAGLGFLLTPRSPAKQRSTAPRPWLRLTARLTDYALWGLVLMLALRIALRMRLLGEPLADLLDHPLLTPVLVTFTWVPIEAVLLAVFSATPAKLLLDIRVTFHVTDPYASDSLASRLAAALVRAYRVWWSGVAGGITPIYLFTMAGERRMLKRVKETSWDFDGDCLVTHGRMHPATALVGAAVLGTAAWLSVTHWAAPVLQLITAGRDLAISSVAIVRETLEPLRPQEPVQPPPAPDKLAARAAARLDREAKARQLTAAHDWKGLADHCNSWTQIEEHNGSAWFCLGRARQELGDHEGAVTAFKRAAPLDPDNTEIRRLLLISSEADMRQKQMRARQQQLQNTPAAPPPTDSQAHEQAGEPQEKGEQGDKQGP